MLLAAILITSSQLFAFIGFGVTAGQNTLTVPAFNETRGAGLAQIGLNTTEVKNPYSAGAYLYIDVLPFIDLEIDGQITGGEFDFSFYNEHLDLPEYKSAWAAGSFYGTVRKNVVGFNVPILGGANLHAGGGINSHTFSPQMNFENVEKLMGGDLTANESFTQKELENWVLENVESRTGFHVQGGAQFKLLVIDAFIVYRHVFGDFEDIMDSKSFGNLNIRLGFGF